MARTSFEELATRPERSVIERDAAIMRFDLDTRLHLHTMTLAAWLAATGS